MCAAACSLVELICRLTSCQLAKDQAIYHICSASPGIQCYIADIARHCTGKVFDLYPKIVRTLCRPWIRERLLTDMDSIFTQNCGFGETVYNDI